jgi:hypothetical protein
MKPIVAKACAATHAPELMDRVAPATVLSPAQGRTAG